MIAIEAIDDFDEALRQCGVDAATLSARERDALDRQGYALFFAIVDDEWLEAVRATFVEAIAQGKRRGAHVHLPCHDPLFDRIYTAPKVLAAVRQILRRPFRTFP